MSAVQPSRSPLKACARRVLGRYWYPAMEMRNKVVLGPGALALRRMAEAEVTCRKGLLPPQPPATVVTIIPTYRRPELLKRAVQSALDQTVRDHSILIVDDCGGLPALPDDPRLRAVSLSRNTGCVGAVRNIGIRLTESQYVAFLDDDNEWEKFHLETALTALRTGPPDRRPGLVYTSVTRYFPDGTQRDVLATPFDRVELMRSNYIDVSAMVIRRFEKLHFSWIPRPMEVRPREDWELVYRLSRRVRVAHVDVPTVRYLLNPGSYFTFGFIPQGNGQ